VVKFPYGYRFGLLDGHRFGEQGELISKYVNVLLNYHNFRPPGKAVSHEDRGPLLEAVDDIRTALAELEPDDDDLTSFVKMLLGFVQKYGEWECTTEKSYAKLLAQNPAGGASGTPQK
jgi:hypothetical protein